MRRRLLVSGVLVACRPARCRGPGRRRQEAGADPRVRSMVGVTEGAGRRGRGDPRHQRRGPAVGRRLGEGQALGRWPPRGQGQGPGHRSRTIRDAIAARRRRHEPEPHVPRGRELPRRRRRERERAQPTRSRRRPGWAAATRRSSVQLDLPEPCIAPIMLVTSPDTGPGSPPPAAEPRRSVQAAAGRRPSLESDGRPLAGPAVCAARSERALVAAGRDLDGALGERVTRRVAFDALRGPPRRSWCRRRWSTDPA